MGAENTTQVDAIPVGEIKSESDEKWISLFASISLIGLIVMLVKKDISPVAKKYGTMSNGLLVVGISTGILQVLVGFLFIIGIILSCILSIFSLVLFVFQIYLMYKAYKLDASFDVEILTKIGNKVNKLLGL